MAVYLHSIETVVPPFGHDQQRIGQAINAGLSDRRLERLAERVYRQSGIETRHSVIGDFKSGEGENAFFDEHGHFKRLGTKARNDFYTEAAKALYVNAARCALAHTQDTTLDEITHVITVSCTGFFAPGPDYFIVKELGLSPATGRYHVGFMGCYATFPALKMARAFCEADENAVVLVVSVELCTLHLRPPEDVDSILATSVFADGGGAVLMSSKAPSGQVRALEVGAFATTLTPVGEADMAWTIGDEGFNMVLSTYVPQILEANIGEAVQPLLEETGIDRSEVDHWAIHPGGRAILDKVEKSLELSQTQLEPSRTVLRDYGNMSSATVLFVLKEILKRAQPEDAVYALAFGPGLTVESGLFKVV